MGNRATVYNGYIVHYCKLHFPESFRSYVQHAAFYGCKTFFYVIPCQGLKTGLLLKRVSGTRQFFIQCNSLRAIVQNEKIKVRYFLVLLCGTRAIFSSTQDVDPLLSIFTECAGCFPSGIKYYCNN